MRELPAAGLWRAPKLMSDSGAHKASSQVAQVAFGRCMPAWSPHRDALEQLLSH